MSKRMLFTAGICIALLMSLSLACCCPVGLPTGDNFDSSSAASVPRSR